MAIDLKKLNVNVAYIAAVSFGFFFLVLGYFQWQGRGQSTHRDQNLAEQGHRVLSEDYHETCLYPDSDFRPVWECYEVTLVSPVDGEISIHHESGLAHRTITFEDGGETKFRFTPSLSGRWEFSSGGEIDISDYRPDYAKGFIIADGANWARSATGELFVPQYVMYERPDLERGLQEFVLGHGFTGFHIANLRDFMTNPGYFEAVVLKTYRMGGTTHFWIWGDKSRRQTPSTYGVNATLLYREIAARLSPLPGWTVGYGFDLHEWATADEVEAFREVLRNYSSYNHMVGARGFKNRYQSISENLDYFSWEWHRPNYGDYRNHFAHANGLPTFSEDRFRIRHPSKYPDKDYDFNQTRRGLWYSAISGGVANIWGLRDRMGGYSEAYPNKEALRTYRITIDQYFKRGMFVNDHVLKDGVCLEGPTHFLCFSEDVDRVILSPHLDDKIASMTAIDTTEAYVEIHYNGFHQAIDLSVKSDWAIVLSKDKTNMQIKPNAEVTRIDH